jgi:hypothetical protein
MTFELQIKVHVKIWGSASRLREVQRPCGRKELGVQWETVCVTGEKECCRRLPPGGK